MKLITKILLATSITGFVLSLTPLGAGIHYGMLKPVSVLLFIVFFILHLLNREMESFDAEHEANIARARENGSLKSTKLPEARATQKHPFATAGSNA